ELASAARQIADRTAEQLRACQLQSALETIWSLITLANQYVDHTAPFKLAKDPAQSARLDEVLFNVAEVCRILAVLLWPFLPATSERIYSQLGLPGRPDKFTEASWGKLSPGHAIGEIAPLFPRKDLAAPPGSR